MVVYISCACMNQKIESDNRGCHGTESIDG